MQTLTKLIKGIPFIHREALKIKHAGLQKKTVRAYNSYINSGVVANLQLGAGTKILPGWFNTDYLSRKDVFFLDVTKSFPFAANSFQWAFSEHQIEHIEYKDARTMLAETFRVLKSGGKLKVTTPNLRKYLEAYVNENLNSELIREHVKLWIYSGFAYSKNYRPVNENYEAHFINDIFLNYEHRFIYDAAALSLLMQNAGFVDIKVDDDSPDDVVFMGIEAHDGAFDQAFTLKVTGTKA